VVNSQEVQVPGSLGQLVVSGARNATSIGAYAIEQVPGLATFAALRTIDELSQWLGKEPECAKARYRDETPEAKRLALNSLLTDTYIPTNRIAEFVQTLGGTMFSALNVRDFSNPRYASFFYQQEDLLMGKNRIKPMPGAPFTSQVFGVIGSSGSGKSMLCDRLYHLLGSAQRLRCSPPLPDFLATIPVLKLEWKNSRPEFLRHIRYVLRAEVANANASDRLLREIESDIHGANAVKSWLIQFNIGVILIDGCNNASLTTGTPEVLDTIAEVSKWTGIPVVIFGTPLFMHRLANGSMPGPYLTSGPKLDLDDFSPPLKGGKLDINGGWYSTVSEVWRMSAMSLTEMHKDFPLWAYEHSPVLQHMVYGVWDFMRHSIAFTQSGETFEFGEESEQTAQDAEPRRKPLRHPESLEASNLKAGRVKKTMAHSSKMSKRLREIAYQIGTTGHVQSEDDFRRYPDNMPSEIVCNPAYESWVGTGLTSGIRPSPRSVGIIRSPKPKASAIGQVEPTP
jgi:hypothetical protein